METKEEPKTIETVVGDSESSELSASLTAITISEAGANQTPVSMDCDAAGGCSSELTTSNPQPRSKPSGAQLRKAARMKAHEQGLPVKPRKRRDKDRRSKSEGGGGRAGAEAFAPRGAVQSLGVAGPSTPLRNPATVPEKLGAGGMTPRKRTRTPQHTPPSSSRPAPKKKPRGAAAVPPVHPPTGGATGSYSSTLSATKVVIVHGNHPVERLSDVEAQ